MALTQAEQKEKNNLLTVLQPPKCCCSRQSNTRHPQQLETPASTSPRLLTRRSRTGTAKVVRGAPQGRPEKLLNPGGLRSSDASSSSLCDLLRAASGPEELQSPSCDDLRRRATRKSVSRRTAKRALGERVHLLVYRQTPRSHSTARKYT